MSNGLGRGLSSLIPPKVNKNNNEPEDDLDMVEGASTMLSDNKDKVLKIKPDKIKVNPMQPRSSFSDYNMDELVDSIKEYGVIQPLIVTKNNNEYELIAGERRLRAAKMAGLKMVPVLTREAEASDSLELSILENIQREDLNPIEEARAYKQMLASLELTQEELAGRVGKDRSSIANTVPGAMARPSLPLRPWQQVQPYPWLVLPEMTTP